ncbi:Ankyrin-2 [Triplophysa tibetana]|uniref:Ankyrin-2 n=1 Tax=Triplophysa tibetana TaxID=1572043 RepID=A0A5A9PPU5_9TELE|nr:Ankyrin-2 [Triplophysa tibetana]
MEDDEDTETTETTFLKTQLIRDSPALATPDLLSEVSEMKQDLIKMTAILTTDSSEKTSPMQGDYLDKGAEEVSAEPFEIMEKVKEDLEKVSEILRSGTCEKEDSAKAESHSYRKDEGWVLLTDSEIEEAKMMAAFASQESLLKEARVNRGSHRGKGPRGTSGIETNLSSEGKEYLLDAPETSRASFQDTASQQRFTEVVLRRGGRKIVPTVVKDTKTELKKPVRKKGPHGQTDETQLLTTKEGIVSKTLDKSPEGDDLLPVPGDQRKSPVSPVVEETPIGSIKEKVKALQKKVEEEKKCGKKQIGQKTPNKAAESKPSTAVKEQKTSGLKKQSASPQKQTPPKTTKPESEKLEETMSVRELMRAFQKGQDPSKRKSGLFEHKGSSKTDAITVNQPEAVLTMSKCLPQTPSHDVSLDVLKPGVSKDTTGDQKSLHFQKDGEGVASGQDSGMIKAISQRLSRPYLLPDSGTENSAFDESSESLKHEGLIDSPNASLGEVEATVSSEDSYKHEGMAESPETSPESLSSLKKTTVSVPGKTSKAIAVTPKVKTSKVSVSFSTEGKTAIDQISEDAIHRPAASKAVGEPTKSESMCSPHSKVVKFGNEQTSVDKDVILVSSKPPKSRKLTKRHSETLESFLSDEESFDGQPTYTDSLAARAPIQDHGGLVLPLRQQDSETLSPVADDSFTISHKDSLEGSPLMEDNSSHKTPDSIEPSPTKESPCRDSLESSPIEQKTNPAFPPTVEQPSATAAHLTSSGAPEIPPDSLRSRILKEQEGNADEDSCEQTSLMTSSGKSPLSPDTPSSEEVSYEVNPKTPDPMILIVPLKPSIIPEEAVEDDDELKCGMKQRKITPEEEMFKMAAKIKTFDEMEQDEKDKMDNRKDSESSQTLLVSDAGDVNMLSKHETSSVDDIGFTESKQASEVARSFEPIIKVQTPSPFPAGIHMSPQTAEDVRQTMAQGSSFPAESAVGRPQSVSEKHTVKPQGLHSEKHKDKGYVNSELSQSNKTASNNNKVAANITDEQKEESLKRSRESQEILEKQSKAAIQKKDDLKSHSQKECNVTDEIKGDNMKHAGTSYGDICSDSLEIVIGETKETFKQEICIYDDTEEDDAGEEPPKTESRGVTAKAESDAWNSMREDDAAFAARLKEEEQKILSLAVDSHSQGETPDTTRTPTEEGTPTSERNPFLFQEGKLFEMTRSGAIDMTKRSYEEGFAFFQIGEQPVEEGLLEEGGGEPARPSSDAVSEVGCNLSLKIRPEEDQVADLSVRSSAEAVATVSDASKSKTSVKTSEKNQTVTETVDVKSDKVIKETHLESDLDSSDTVITNIQTAVSTVTRSVHSQQDQESSDSSPEDQHSVIELPMTPEKTSPSSEGVSKSQSKVVSKSRPVVSSSAKTRKNISTSKEVERPKSKIPVKASSLKSEPETSAKRAEPSKDKKSKLPRRKSETDTGLTVGSSFKKSSKAKSFCESDSNKRSNKKDQGRPASTDLANKVKTIPSRLPVRGKPGQPMHTSTPAKPKKGPSTDSSKQPDAFFEEISQEAAKVVKSLAQAEKEKEETAALSDDESSTIDASVVEMEPFPDMQMPFPEDPLVIRPRWDDPVETQMERIPADKVRCQELARELKFSDEQINRIRNGNPNSLQDQSHALIKLWKEREGNNPAENTLMKTLTKINRMDIVHLIETKIMLSSQKQSLQTYAEIEQTISLDHSEGFSALQDDMDSPGSGRRAAVTQRGSEPGPLVASVEDLSFNASSLHESQKETLLTEKKKDSDVVGGSAQSGFEFVGLKQQFPGTTKKVSPFFTLYKAVPWRLQSQVYDPVYKGASAPKESSDMMPEMFTPSSDDSLQELGATGGRCILVYSKQDAQETSPPIHSLEGCRLQNQRQTTLLDFEYTLLESEKAETDFSELSVELQHGPEDYFSSDVSRTSYTFPSSEKTMFAQDENLLPNKPSQSEEYMKRHIEEISDRFYRTLFGEGYVSTQPSRKCLTTETYKDMVSTVGEVALHAGPAYIGQSLDVTTGFDVDQFTVRSPELATESLASAVSGGPQKRHVCITPEDSNTFNQMSLDSINYSGYPEANPLSTGQNVEIDIPIILTSPADAESTKNKHTSKISAEVAEYRPLTPILLTSRVETRSLSPDTGLEYVDNFAVTEYRSLSPESVLSVPLDSPISFEYRPLSPDSCTLMDCLRASSPESVSSVNDWTLLSVDSPLPDFRPSTPLPTEFVRYVEEYKTPHSPGAKRSPLSELTKDTPGTSYQTDDTVRPASPGSVISCQSVSSKSDGSWSPVSFGSEISDGESFERSFEHYTPSPNALLPETRPSSPESTASVNAYRVLSPDSPIPCFAVPCNTLTYTGYTSPSLQSDMSDSDCDLVSLKCFVGSRPSSPESVASLNELRCLSPDSPLPSFIQTVCEYFIPTKLYRSESAESSLSNSENSPVLDDPPVTRPSSPESFVSINEHRPLSPDSPIPEFQNANVILFESFRNSSPELDISDIEYSQCGLLFSEQRPESLISEPECNLLSLTEGELAEKTFSQIVLVLRPTDSVYNQEYKAPDIRQYGAVDQEHTLVYKAELTNRIAKVFDPQYKGETFCAKPGVFEYISEVAETETLSIGQGEVLSGPKEINNQVVPREEHVLKCPAVSQYENESVLSKFESTVVTDYRSSSPESPSELDIQTDVFDNMVIDVSRSSPESITSVHANRPLSPDSPVPDFTPSSEYRFMMSETGSRSASPESACLSDENECCLSNFNPEQRSDSPASRWSDIEDRPLSADSPVPQFSALFHESTLQVIGYRPCSPQSLCSETSLSEVSLEDVLTLEHRPDSPDSVLSEPDKRLPSADSLNEWRPMSPESVMLLEDIRGCSPQSVGSIDECRPLSPDSPVPQYFPAFFESVPLTGHRSSSPESVVSEEEHKLNVFTLASLESLNERRSLSPKSPSPGPDSPIPQFYSGHFESIIITGYKSSSPESVLSELDIQMDVFDNMVIDVSRSSPESISSVHDNRPLSPDSPVPDFTPSSIYTFMMSETGSRSASPESACLSDENECCLSDFHPEQQSDSPESRWSDIEDRRLSPDSPVPQFSALFHESTLPLIGHRSCSPQSLCSETSLSEVSLQDLLTLEHRPDSPDSVLSETDKRPPSADSLNEWRPMSPESVLLLEDIRGCSPQSVGSIDECRPLSPDSPVPQYFPAFFESVPLTGHRSSSPESVVSEEEHELNVFTLAFLESLNERRSLSPKSPSPGPDSPIPQFYSGHFESIIITGYRSSSPESVWSELDIQMDAFDDMVIDVSRSSPESITSVHDNRPLSPDSPVPDFTPSSIYRFMMSETGSRSASPESACLSDENECCPSNFNPEQRSDSPESRWSDIEDRPLSPDSPVPQFSALFHESTLPVIGHRSCSPQSLCSETSVSEVSLEDLLTLEHRPDSPDSVLSETDKRPPSADSLNEWRPMSPESVLLLEDIRGCSPTSVGSIDECRPLSPDSPVPQYFPAFFESVPLTGHRSSSPESVVSEEEHELNVFTLASLESLNERRSLSPKSPSPGPDSPITQFYSGHFESIIITGYRSSSPESVLSELDIQMDAFDDMVIDVSRSSPESITSVHANRPLSPDSPVPDFTPSSIYRFMMSETGSGSVSPESACLSDENECRPSNFNPEQRSDSPESRWSDIEDRPLSPDSPVPQFSALFHGSTLPVMGYRSCSPQSLCSETSLSEVSLEDLLTLEHRPDSPDSVLSETDKRPPSADSLNEWRPMSPESVLLLEDIRGCSPTSVGSMDECRPLSPDSPVPQYFPAFFESVPLTGHRSSSPESVVSEEEHELNVFTLASLESLNERRSLSPKSPSPGPDSPITQFYSGHFESIIITGYRSSSPESVLSELDIQMDAFDDMVIDVSRSSPESITSVHDNRPLSPDSPVPDFTPSSIYRFMMSETGSRSASPESACFSDENECCLSDFHPEQRSDSPESRWSDIEDRPLSPDSPVPQFSALFHESTLPVIGHRSCSPQSLCSETSVSEVSLEDLLTLEHRPDSPDSVLSETDKRPPSADSLNEWRPMSPESVMLLEDIRGCSPQYFPAFFESVPLTGHRSSSPESVVSEEEHELNVFTLASLESLNERRSLSPKSPSPEPDSPTPQFYSGHFESIIITGYRSSSPESVLSELDIQMDVFDNMVIDVSRSSPESITSVHDNRPLSPDSPVPDFTPSSIYRFMMSETGSGSVSPESACLSDENECCPSNFNPEQRSDSPESRWSDIEDRPLSPDSPVPQFSALFHGSTLPVMGHRSCSPQSLCSETSLSEVSLEDLLTLEHRPDSPDSVLSETDKRPPSADSLNEWRPMSPESVLLLEDIRECSPQSVGSIDECRPLSPDSPVPQYFPAFFESVPLTGHRSSSPESVVSEEEHELNVFTLASLESLNDRRSLSPDSPSPGPDSPIPQFYSGHFESIMITGYRSSSPDSVLSELDIQMDVFDDMVIDASWSSPESITSVHANRPLATDSPVPDFTPSSICTFMMSETGSRSASPESTCLSDENECCVSDFNPEQRSDSPESRISDVEDRPLSPDLPVPEFILSTYKLIMSETGSRSASPASLCLSDENESLETRLSDIKGRPLSPDSICDYRSLSPHTVISTIDRSSPDSFLSLEECRPLSPDSPVPQFSCVCEITSVKICRSESIESLASDTDVELSVFASQTSEQRPLSPESIVSLNETRPLSPDSPISDFTSLVCVNVTQVNRSSSLESIASDTEFDLASFASEDLTWTPVRRSSPESGEVFTVEEFCSTSQKMFRKVSQYKLVCKAVPSALMSHLHDPHYKGESFCPKPGVFEYAGYAVEMVKTHSERDTSNKCVPNIVQRSVQPHLHKSVDLSEENEALSPDSLSECESLYECLMFVSDSRASSPQSYISVNENSQLSPESPIPEQRLSSLCTTKFLMESRNSSPEASFSVNEFQRLSPDSPVPAYLTPSPVPNEYTFESSIVHESDFSPLLPAVCDVQTLGSVFSQWTIDEPRPFSPVSDGFHCDSRSLPPQSSCFESELRYPSPEAATLELIETVTPEPLVFEAFDQAESPSSVTELETEEIVDSVSQLPIHDTEGIQKDDPCLPKSDSSLLNLVTFAQCKIQTESLPETEGQLFSEIECTSRKGLKPSSNEMTSEMRQGSESETKASTTFKDKNVYIETDTSASEEITEGFTILQSDNRGSQRPHEEELGHQSSEVSPQESKERDSVTMKGSHVEAQEIDLDPIQEETNVDHQVQLIAPSWTCVSHQSVPNKPEQSLSQPTAPHVPSAEEHQTSTGLQEFNLFQFHLCDSHRRVTPHLIDFSQLSLSLESQDNKNSRSVKAVSTGIKSLPSFSESSLVFPGTYPLVPAVTSSSLEVTREFKGSEMPAGTTASLDVDSPLYDLDLKARVRPVHSDSVESEAEFFDCRQTFSDTSDPDAGAAELLDVPPSLYQVEELLSCSPDYLTNFPKLREYQRKDERPLSWGSEDLPIVLEPEDEEKDFPDSYTGDHSYAEELTPRIGSQYDDDDDDSLGREIAEELGLLSDSSEEEVLTTRVVRRRVIIQGDDMPEISPHAVTEEQYTDEHGNMVIKKITRKVIRKFVSADGVEREEVLMMEGPQQESVRVDEADAFSKVLKRTVVRSAGDQTQVTFSEPSACGGATASEFEDEPVLGRKVSKVVKTMVVHGERMEKHIGDPSLSSDLPSAKDDFEKALTFLGGFDKVLLPHLVEKEVVKEDGSVVKRTRMHKTRTQKQTVVRDGRAKQTHLERLEDTPDTLRPDDLQQHLSQLLQRYCTPEVTDTADAGRDAHAGEQDEPQ